MYVGINIILMFLLLTTEQWKTTNENKLLNFVAINSLHFVQFLQRRKAVNYLRLLSSGV
jgi:hypothetical protein